jgi:hypothetical protein
MPALTTCQSHLLHYVLNEMHSEEQITHALRNNSNAAAIAREHGLTHKQVWRIARTAGIDLTAGRAAKGNPAFSPAECERMCAAFQANPLAGPVAALLTAEFGRPVTRWAVAYQARKQGLLPPLKSRVTTPPAADLDIPLPATPDLIRERTPEQHQADLRALMDARQDNQRDDRPLPAGHGWDVLIALTPSLADTPYRAVFGLKGPAL